jgi:Skp family chaperone for outer membrane proteins
MVYSTRGILALGLGVIGLAFLVGPSLAQQDAAVRKATAPNGTPKPKPVYPPMIGTVDMDAVFKAYEKFKATNKEFQAAVLARQNDLMKIKAEGDEETQMLAKLNPGTEDFKRHENKVTELKARLAAGREQAQREFQLRESENVATIYKEVQLMVTAVAQWRKLTYVVRVTNLQPSGTDPNSVMAALQNTMIYYDSRNDTTEDDIYNRNRRYQAAIDTPAPRGNTATPPAAAAAPAANNAAQSDQN